MMKRVVFSCLAAGLIALPGCSDLAGPKTMRVQGDVSFDGKPVPDGIITFEGTDGAPPSQGPIKAGHFDIPAASGPVADKVYLVKINALTKSGKTVKNIMDETSPTMEVMAETIPSVFNTQSTMKKTISSESDKNQFAFKLMPSGAYE
jgi:hypothetical protein